MTEIALHPLTLETAGLLRGTTIFDNPVRDDQLAAFLADPGHAMVLACAGDAVVGFASGTVLRHPDKDPAFFLNEVEVAEDWRRRGIATRLVAALRARAGALGCSTLWLATERDNAPARGLYRAAGAEETEGIVVYEWPASE